MTEQNLEQSIFLHALGLAKAEDRAAYLDQACRDRPELRAEVDALIAAHDRLGGAGPSPIPPDATLGSSAEGAGQNIGPYKLLEQIGEGGMGVVWMAEQKQPIQRRVALKVIKAGMDSRQVLARFEAERQALALMDHPNIARVLDAGVTGTGRPYFVMELVKGFPITQYCDEKHLSVRERLELFGDVCRAVQHAHQKGIIHRDLKPSNILIAPFDGQTVVKVIDFGVAKATGQRLTDATLFTGFGAVVGTPEYMSPEQAETNNQDIDTRSDIYSLGVLLYELLTGSTPLTKKRVKDLALLELLRVIREEEPPKPSTRLSSTAELPSISAQRHTDPAKLTSLVRGELDWIVMKALEKDRNRRYETASGFAQDLQRYLDHEPVRACPPSAIYRFRKFARRQRTALAIASVLTVALLVVLGVVAGSVGWAVRDRASRQAVIEAEVNLALKEAARLQAQRKYAEALSAALRAGAILSDGGSQELQKRAADLRKDLQMVLRLESIPLEGSRSTSDGGFDFAREDQAYAEAFREFGVDARVLGAQEIADRTSATTIRLELASELDNWFFTRWMLRPEGDEFAKKLMAAARLADPDELRNRIRDAQQTRDANALSDLLRTEGDRALQWPTSRLLFAAFFQLEPERLRSARLMTLTRRLYRHRPNDFWNNFTLAMLHASQNPPQWEDAARYYTAALALQPDNATTQNDLARLLVNWPRPGDSHFEEAIDLAQKAVQATPTAGNYWITLGIAHYRVGQWTDALAAFQQAAKLRNGGDGLDWLFLAMTHGRLGEKEQGRKWYDQAVEWMEKNNTDDAGLKHMRAEAAELLGVTEGEPLKELLKQFFKHG
jgi:serine/threonine protein kinase